MLNIHKSLSTGAKRKQTAEESFHHHFALSIPHSVRCVPFRYLYGTFVSFDFEFTGAVTGEQKKSELRTLSRRRAFGRSNRNEERAKKWTHLYGINSTSSWFLFGPPKMDHWMNQTRTRKKESKKNGKSHKMNYRPPNAPCPCDANRVTKLKTYRSNGRNARKPFREQNAFIATLLVERLHRMRSAIHCLTKEIYAWMARPRSVIWSSRRKNSYIGQSFFLLLGPV